MDRTDPYYKPAPRWLLRVWAFVRDGMPAVGRYRRYIVTMAIPLAAIWIVTIAYLALYMVDARWMKVYWPAWYLRLRLVLTSVVLVCQLTAAAWFLLLHTAH